MNKEILCVDMDAFYASVEIRDNPDLARKPLIIGALPQERGVVSTCSYEARKYGVRSAMSIKDAYRLCPTGIYMHPNFHKYEEASRYVHEIMNSYTDVAEYISLDEGFLDVTYTSHLFGGAVNIGREIKKKVKDKTGLTCSVGIGYSLMSAKLASEEKKPDGFFEIPTPEFLKTLIIDRSVRVIYGVGAQTADELKKIKVHTIRDIYNRKNEIINLFGNHGRQIVELAEGIDARVVARQPKSKSLGKEQTFQRDTADFDYLKDVLRLLARELSFELRVKEMYCRTITLKITYKDMKKITRSKSGDATNRAEDMYSVAAALLDSIDKRPVRLAGISLSGFTDAGAEQLSLFTTKKDIQAEKLDAALTKLQLRYGIDIVKTGSELNAEKNLHEDSGNLENEFNN